MHFPSRSPVLQVSIRAGGALSAELLTLQEARRARRVEIAPGPIGRTLRAGFKL
jgi:hypothetical protein